MQRGVVVVHVGVVGLVFGRRFSLAEDIFNISLHFFEQLVFERHNDTVFHTCNDSKRT